MFARFLLYRPGSSNAILKTTIQSTNTALFTFTKKQIIMASKNGYLLKTVL